MQEASRQDAVLSPSDDTMHPERLRFALGVGSTGIWNWQSGTETLFGDRGLSLLWGLPPGQAISTRMFKESIDPQDIERVTDELLQAAAPEGPDSSQIEFRIRRYDDGAERWILLQGRRYPADVAGETDVELIGLARDVTSRKQRETHLHVLDAGGDASLEEPSRHHSSHGAPNREGQHHGDGVRTEVLGTASGAGGVPRSPGSAGLARCCGRRHRALATRYVALENAGERITIEGPRPVS